MKKLVLLFITTLILGGLFAAPLNESFSDPTFPPSGWTVHNVDGGQAWIRNTSSTHYYSAPGSAYIKYDSSSTHNDWLVTPCLVPSAANYTLSFWASHYSNYPETFKVWVSTASNAVSDFTIQLGSEITTTTTWTQYDYNLSAYIGTPIYVAIQATALNQFYLRVDDFTGPDLQMFPEPSSHVTGFTATPDYFNVKLDWTGSTGTDLPIGYLIQAIKVGAGSYAAVADGTPVADDSDWSDGNAAVNVVHVVGANTYTFTGLDQNTAYEFKIWPYTNNGADIDFKVDAPIPTLNTSTLDTTIYAADLPHLQNFDAVTIPALPAGWSKQVSSSSSYATVVTYATGTPNSTPNHIRMYNGNDTAADLVLISPLIDPNLTDLRVRFWAKGGTDLTLQVGTMDGTGSRAVFTNVETVTLNSNYTEYTVNFNNYAGTDQHIAFKHGVGATYRTIYIDDILFENIPQAGLLTVNPNPVECGNSYIGFEKTVQVSLTNTGVAAFDVTSIALADYTNFNLANLPTLPVTINPGDPAVTFDVVFNPTVAGALTTNLLINDTRQVSSIVVNGTGEVMPVGEICENPYLATLPLIDYAGTTNGYANDYTAAMFTGLGSNYYVQGPDWVAKVTIPGNGWLDISLANPSGDTSSYYPGIFLVNTIPSLANPAAVLAQAYGNVTSLNITDEVVSAGDYYVIVDNWAPNPDYINFVLNISFEPVSTPPNPATLVSPADDATNVLLTQTLNWSSGGGFVEGYRLSFGTVNPYTTVVNNVDLGMDTTYTPTLNYSTEYWWTVTPYNSIGDASPVTEWSFITRDDPTKPLPYVQNFDSGTSLTDIDWTGNMSISSTHGNNSTNGLYRNLYSTVPTCNAVTPPIGPMTNGVELKFDYRIVNYTGYPNNATVLGANDNIQVLISTDSGTTYSTIHTINQANHVTSTSFAMVTVPLTAYTTGNIMLKFQGNRGEGDYYVDFDNVIVRVAPTAPEAPILVYPADGATDLPKTGFNLTWQNNPLGMVPDYFKVFLWTDEQGEYCGPYWETADATVTSLNPTVVIPEGATEPFSFAYDEHWNWTVAAVVGSVEEVAVSRQFTIQSDPTITNFPWDEDFEDGVFPPIGWTVVDVDGGGTCWEASTTQNHTTGGTTSARHVWSSLVPAPGQNGWLITPPAAIPNSTNNVFLSWWNYNQYASDMEYNGVKVNTTNDPTDPNWVELWSQDSAAAAWGNEVLDINAYKGQTVYFAFNYQGYNADAWHVDDVSIYEVAAALDAPVVTIALTSGQPTLSWDAVTGANSYLVYGATDPYAADPWTLLDTVYTTGYTYTGTAPMEFFKVVASDVAAPARGTVQPTPQKNTQIHNAPKVKLDNGSQGDFRIRLRK